MKKSDRPFEIHTISMQGISGMGTLVRAETSDGERRDILDMALRFMAYAKICSNMHILAMKYKAWGRCVSDRFTPYGTRERTIGQRHFRLPLMMLQSKGKVERKSQAAMPARTKANLP